MSMMAWSYCPALLRLLRVSAETMRLLAGAHYSHPCLQGCALASHNNSCHDVKSKTQQCVPCDTSHRGTEVRPTTTLRCIRAWQPEAGLTRCCWGGAHRARSLLGGAVAALSALQLRRYLETLRVHHLLCVRCARQPARLSVVKRGWSPCFRTSSCQVCIVLLQHSRPTWLPTLLEVAASEHPGSYVARCLLWHIYLKVTGRVQCRLPCVSCAGNLGRDLLTPFCISASTGEPELDIVHTFAHS
jgi:hypothetical protein